MKNYTSAVPVERTVSRIEYTPMIPCPDCDGRGYTYSDPDGKQLICQTCGETDSAAFAGMDAADKTTMKDLLKALELIFSRDDPDEASPEDRKNAKSIKDIAAELVFGDGKEET